MVANSVVQARIDEQTKIQASEVLDQVGLSVSDVIRILLTRIANEGSLPPSFVTNEKVHDEWFKAKVQEALRDSRSSIAHECVEEDIGKRKAELMAKMQN